MVFTDDARERLFRAAIQAARGDQRALERASVRLVEALTGSLSGSRSARLDPALFGALVRAGLRIARRHDPESISVTVEAAHLPLDGTDRPVTLLQTVMADQPFLVDTVLLSLEQEDIQPLRQANFVYMAERGEEHALTDAGPARPGAASLESLIQVVLPEIAPDAMTRLRADVLRRLEIARQMVADFDAMRSLVEGARAALAAAEDGLGDEAAAFLGWLLEDHFVFIGAQRLKIRARRGGGIAGFTRDLALGAERATPREPSDGALIEGLLRADAPSRVGVHKIPWRAEVHRSSLYDEVVVALPPQGRKAREIVVVRGQFTFRALREAASEIPVLRQKANTLIDERQLIRSTFDYKEWISAFDSLPVEYLFEAEIGAIREVIELLLDAATDHEVRARVAVDPSGRGIYALAVIPDDRFRDELRVRLRDRLRAAVDAVYADHRVVGTRFGSTVVHLYLSREEPLAASAPRHLEELILEVASPWSHRLDSLLAKHFPLDEATSLQRRYGAVFPEVYRDRTAPERAVRDIVHLEETRLTHRTSLDLFADPTTDQACLRLYHEQDLLLSEVLPVLDHFGLAVVRQEALRLPLEGETTLVVHTYFLHLTESQEHLRDGDRGFLAALAAVLRGDTGSDILSRLCVSARIRWRALDLLRGCVNYLRQAGGLASASLTRRLLVAHPPFAAALCDLFAARFDPTFDDDAGGRKRRVSRAERVLAAYLETLQTFEEDRIFRCLHALVRDGISRTNLYLPARRDDHLVSFKVITERVPALPAPRPVFEIFVYHARVEGVHMRVGPVARGGIRHSDRMEDFRTEVLGLMRTQRTKNSIIVPVGAKGGFIVKEAAWTRFAPEPDGDRTRPQWAYDQLISGMLDLADNRVAGETEARRPRELINDDAEDSYLVVAADKGTATYSDRANAAASARGFWLDDAFASGGSSGYDHKRMGITAKGAWACARRHFAEMGIDPERDPIRVAGIGDMSGDVFGNGMLCSRTIRLLAAFNHLHIFVDPDPDPDRSFEERKRLFALPRSAWTDYDQEIISAGGGIFRRDARKIPLSAAARALFGLGDEEVSGETLIQHILRLEVELLWNGGIGTYVRASTERDADVQDKSNDRVRVAADTVRARIIAEGGNLGVTQLGRVEFALRGGRINTDAIDNSGGVDCSDHEVNLKILFRQATLGDDPALHLERDERDALLREIEPTVSAHVLRHNEEQALMLSMEQLRVARSPMRHVRTQATLAQAGVLDPPAQRLPGVREVRRRVAAGLPGYTRPELAELCAHAKLYLQEQLIATGRPGPFAADLVAQYFPESIEERFGGVYPHHPLYREIAALVQTHHTINEGGAALLPHLAAETDRGWASCADAWWLLDKVYGAGEVRAGFEALERGRGGLPAQVHYTARATMADGLRAGAVWLLRLNPGPKLSALLRNPTRFQRLFDEVTTQVRAQLPAPFDAQVEDLERSLQRFGMAPALATRAALAPFAPSLVSLAFAARTTPRSPRIEPLVARYFHVARRTRLLELYFELSRTIHDDLWEDRAIRTLKIHFLGFLDRFTQLLGELRAPRGRGDDADGPSDDEALLTDRLQFGPLVEAIDEALAGEAGLGRLVVFSESYRRRLQQLAAMVDAGRD